MARNGDKGAFVNVIILAIFLRCPTFPHPCAVLLCSNTTMSPAGQRDNSVIAQSAQPKIQHPSTL